MVSDSEFDTEIIATLFEKMAGNIDYKTVQFILSKISRKTHGWSGLYSHNAYVDCAYACNERIDCL